MKQIEISAMKLDDSEIEAALRVLKSGAILQGKECETFEIEFAEKVGAKYAVASSSGSAALHLSYMAFLEPGDEVLVPSFTFIASAAMISMTRAKPVLCDIDPKTFLIDLNDAEQRITHRTRAIAPAHLFGNACNIEAVTNFAEKYHLKIVWDAAQAHGTMHKAQDIGGIPDFVCYSFYPAKNVFVGEGGMTCTPHAELYEKMKYLRSHGETREYYHTMLGMDYRMSDVEAAIGREQLRQLDRMLEIRRTNAHHLELGIAAIPGIRSQHATPNTLHAWHQYCVYVDAEKFGCDRNTLAEHLKERGIASSIHYPRGVHSQPVFEQLYGRTSLPNTEQLSRGILALPVHHGLQEDDVYRIIEAVEECYDHGPCFDGASIRRRPLMPRPEFLPQGIHRPV
jgi:perosamine synthetase